MISKIHYFFKDRPWLIIVGIVLVTIITLALTLLPIGKVTPEQVWNFDKLGHLLIFGSWTFLIGYRRLLVKPQALNLFTIFFVGVLFGAVVEVLQYAMPFGRSADFLDIAFDALGCFFAVLALYILQKQSYTDSVLQ